MIEAIKIDNYLQLQSLAVIKNTWN